MKRQYSKPDILFEDFSLSTAIAGSCEVKTNTPAQRTCGYSFGDKDVFVEPITACTTKVVDGSYYDGLCYHVPNEGYTLFNS